MITPRRTQLVRVADLHTFRRAIAALAAEGSGRRAQGSVLVVVPTRGAANLLERSVTAQVVTREEMYDRLHARLG